MTHPFALNLSDLETVDLDFQEDLTSDQGDQIEGGILPGGCVVTKAFYEGGGYDCPPPYYKPPVEPPCYYPPSPKPPIYTTLALGEEGGGGPYYI